MDLTVGTFGTFDPFVFAIPEYFAEDGNRQPTHIVVQLTGEQSAENAPNSRLSMSIEESEALASQILQVVADAKAGKFAKIGYEAAQEPHIGE